MRLVRQKSKSDTELEKTSESPYETIKDINERLDVMKEMMGDEKQKTSESESEKKGKGLKIMTPNQLLTRLPILLAQKKAGNNSQKLNNEIRQIIYSLYSSKNLSKAIYNYLMNSI